MTTGDDDKLRLSERKILKKMYGPIFNKTEQKWEIIKNTNYTNFTKEKKWSKSPEEHG